MDQSEASLLGIPPELRLEVYERLFHHHLRYEFSAYFHMYTGLYHRASFPSTTFREIDDQELAIICTCRQIHEETSKLLHSKTRLSIIVRGVKKRRHHVGMPSMGRPENLHFWRFITDLRLDIVLESGRENKAVVLERTRRLTEHALKRGKYLKSLSVVFSSGEDKALPSWYPEVAATLKVLRVCGNVRVRVSIDIVGDLSEDEEDDICLELKMTIGGARDAAEA